MSTIIQFLSSITSAISGWFTWKSSKVHQRELAEKALQKKENEKAALKAKIADAVYSGDDKKLNAIVARLLPVFALCIWGCFVAGCCTSKTVIKYIPTDRRIESCTNSLGIACKAVPNAVFEELLTAQIELQALRREMKIDKQLSQ